MQYRIKYRPKSVLYGLFFIKIAIFQQNITRTDSIPKLIQKIYFQFFMRVIKKGIIFRAESLRE